MDPYTPYLKQADELFAQGETLKAGQIWQAILKQQPAHAAAREGLLKVKAILELQKAAAAQAPAAPPPAPEPAPEPEPTPVPEPVPEAVAVPEPPAPVPPQPQAPVHSDEEIERLLREGNTLYDMGQTEDALRKWELLLAGAPHHRVGRQYANGARKELGLPPLGEDEVPTSAPASPAAALSAPVADHGEDVDRILREAVQLYDMGLPEEAIGKWEKALELEPHRSEIRRYLEDARAEVARHAAAPSAPAPARPSAPTAPMPSAAAQVDVKLKQGEHLLGMQRFDEARFTFQQALDLDPTNAAAREGLRRAQAGEAPRSAAFPTETNPGTLGGGITLVDYEPPAPKTAEIPAATPPATLTKTLPPQREGLKVPAQLNGIRATLEAYPFLKDPKILGISTGALLLTFGSCSFIQGQRKESARKEAVKAAHAAAIAAVAKQAEAKDLVESLGDVKAEGEQALAIDPLRAYLRAEFLLKLAPGDAGGSQLLVKARAALPGGVTGASATELQKHLQERNLDAAAKVLDALLREDPANQELRLKGSRLHLALAQAFAQQEKWDEARLALLRARAFAPGEKAWQARLHLLEVVQGLPKGPQREAWLAFLG